MRNDAWLAGFAAGEGAFLITRTAPNNGRPLRVRPRFCITLRADDLLILMDLQAEFGGSLGFGKRLPAVGGFPASKPLWSWVVCARSELADLIAYFDRYPLRAKKQADYLVWREAVAIYLDSERWPREQTRLLTLRDALAKARIYDADEAAQQVAVAGCRRRVRRCPRGHLPIRDAKGKLRCPECERMRRAAQRSG